MAVMESSARRALPTAAASFWTEQIQPLLLARETGASRPLQILTRWRTIRIRPLLSAETRYRAAAVALQLPLGGPADLAAAAAQAELKAALADLAAAAAGRTRRWSLASADLALVTEVMSNP